MVKDSTTEVKTRVCFMFPQSFGITLNGVIGSFARIMEETMRLLEKVQEELKTILRGTEDLDKRE